MQECAFFLIADMEIADRFDLVYEALIDFYKSYVANVNNTLAVIVVSIGWVLTSDKCRSFLTSNRYAYRLSLAVIASIALIHSLVSVGYYLISQRQMELLQKLKYVPAEYYELYSVNLTQLAINLVLNLLMFSLLFLIVFSLRLKDEQKTPDSK
jgi:hypothetical protein